MEATQVMQVTQLRGVRLILWQLEATQAAQLKGVRLIL
jgi:hypothetical protein